jgi:hypothetical protein
VPFHKSPPSRAAAPRTHLLLAGLRARTMRAAGALARRRPRRVAPVGALAGGPLPGSAASLSPVAGARPLFDFVKRWAGVPERDAQITDLRAENAAQIEAMGDLQARRAARTAAPHCQLSPHAHVRSRTPAPCVHAPCCCQSELQRTRGELSAVQKRVATLQAEKASISAGRAQAALAAEERASRAEAAAEEVRSRLAEVHRLTAPAALAHGGSMVRGGRHGARCAAATHACAP